MPTASCFALGADPERIAWGIEQAREARRKANLSVDGIKFGAYVNLACHADRDTARRLVGNNIATYARFSVMHGTGGAPLSDGQRTAVASLNRSFDMRGHHNAGLLSAKFVDGFAALGPPDFCVERLKVIAALGIGKIVIVGARDNQDPDALQAEKNLVEHVLPEFAN